ncbi:MAG: ArsR family transcriptional regulator, partial [Nitrososphaeria archaeon]|nr:ArsR family transcriptional regulator [Nitrososphaeria archaeon]
FYTLVTHSELTAADLCKDTGIPDSKIYHTLSELERRGMIAVQRQRPTLFKA